MLNMETFAERLRWALDNKPASQSDLARAVGVNRATINFWITGKTKEVEGSNLSKAANYLGVTALWLSTGKGEKESRPNMDIYWPANTTEGPDPVGLVPLISWVQAGAFCTAPDLFHPGDAEKWIPAFKQFGSHTYALRVMGDSMVSPIPGARSYPPGIIIFVDPDKSVENGSRVVARIHDDEAATFKVYSEDAGKRYLRPLNPQYPTIEMTTEMHICGVVVGSWLEE